MKTVCKRHIAILTAVSFVILGISSCLKPKVDVSCKNFVFETLSPCYLSVNEYQSRSRMDTLTEAEALRPRSFKCRVVDGQIRNVDYLTITGMNTDNGWFFGKEIGDTAYYRRIPVVHREDLYFKEKYTKYYIPDRALYWEFQEISIASDNTSFGAEYPVGSDLTPIVLFGFPSLMEFIENGYKGDYTTEHLIRANDKEAWANLKVFETGKPTLIIDRLPTVVTDGGKPTITIRMKFIDKGAILKNKNISWNQYMEIRDDVKPYKEIFDLPVTLQLDIQ